MTKRYPFGSALRGRNPCNSSNFQRIALRILQPPNGAHNRGFILTKPCAPAVRVVTALADTSTMLTLADAS